MFEQLLTHQPSLLLISTKLNIINKPLSTKRYVDVGVTELSVGKMKSMIEHKYNTITDATVEFCSAKVIREVFVGFQQHLYRD